MTAVVQAAGLDQRAAVTLSELNAAAAMLTRVDRKYVVSVAVADVLVGALPPGVRVLEIDGRRRFAYHSTYYDTGDLTSFFDTARRRRRRFKVRARTYLDSGERFLEVKTRRGGLTVKQRRPWSGSGPLDTDALRFVVATLDAEGIPAPARLEPLLEVTYLRSTFLLPRGEGRLTLDRSVEWRDRRSGAAFAPPALAIVETKSGSTPSAADRQLWRAGQRPSSVSKYATGLAALRPELPRNRWNRLLASGPFAVSPEPPSFRLPGERP